MCVNSSLFPEKKGSHLHTPPIMYINRERVFGKGEQVVKQTKHLGSILPDPYPYVMLRYIMLRPASKQKNMDKLHGLLQPVLSIVFIDTHCH